MNPRPLYLIDSLSMGGAEQLLVTYAAQARLAAQPLTVISLRPRGSSPVWERLEKEGARVYGLAAAPLFSSARFALLLQTLSRLQQQQSWQLLHTHLTYANILGIAAAHWLRAPVIVSMHNVLRGRTAARERLERGLLPFADRIVAVGEQVGAELTPLFPGKVETIVNAVPDFAPPEPARRQALRQTLGLTPENLLLLAVGRLTAQKAFDELLQAFALLWPRFPQARLLVAGEGELRPALEAQTQALGLDSSVRWLGLRSDMPDLLAAADIYVSASHWEGLSVALLEAMSAGLPPVATAVGDSPRVIAPGCGLLVPPASPQILAQALGSLLADPAQRTAMGQAAREQAQKKYGAAAWYERLQAVYRRVSEERGISCA